ncbi:uncharacterized protein LOC141601529 [Silene latifolia]|uniref:uncharacterized protein LOC141601529 n=1 Tax=Silene latifolia TaxID=37657 RepID=UPI003D76D78C
MDIAATGAFYTWNNKQPPETRVYSRLDRWLVNQDWMDMFSDYIANFLPEVKKLKLLKPDLKKLNKAHFSDIENKADIAQLRLKKLQEHIMAKQGDKDLIQQEYEANQTFNVLYSAKMDYLKQKAKAHWLKDGDSNSAYFHGVLRARRNKNFICQINDQ